MVGNRADAEDLAQETFTRAYRSLPRFPTRTDPRPPTPRLAVDHRPQPHPQPGTDGEPQATALGADRPLTGGVRPGPEDAALIAEAEREWHRRLAALRPAQRTAVVLRHVVGLSYEEIAEATGRPSGTVKADVHRGLAKLRALLDEEER